MPLFYVDHKNTFYNTPSKPPFVVLLTMVFLLQEHYISADLSDFWICWLRHDLTQTVWKTPL